jgi:uncharacterized membrane protein
MSKGTRWLIGLASFVAMTAMFAPVYFYVKDFGDLPRSSNPSDWGTFGDFFGGILNTIISFLTLIVTIIIAVYINKIEKRNHDETVHNTVKPLFTISSEEFFSSDISIIGLTINEDFYDYTAPQGPAHPHDYLSKQFYLKISNKGLGIATKVSATFEIDLSELRKILLINDPKIKVTSTDVETDEDGRKFIVLNIKADHFRYEAFMYKIWEMERTGLGVIDKEKEVQAVIPSQIIGAFQLFNLIRRLANIGISFPTMYVTLHYKNIHDKALSSKFRVGLWHIHDYPHFSMFKIVQEQI